MRWFALVVLARSPFALAEPLADPQREIPRAERRAHAHRLAESAARTRRTLADASSRGAYAFRDSLDGLDSDQTLPQDAPGNYIRLGDLTPAARGDEVPGVLNGQLNPDGMAWQSVGWGGIVDNATALSNTDGDPSNGEYNGPPGGPDPTGVRGGMLSVQRASINDEPANPDAGIETYEFFTGFYTGTVERPLFVEFDIYKPDHETFQWLRPISYTEGYFAEYLYMGGRYTSGVFSLHAQLFGDPDVIEGVLVGARLVKGGIEYVLCPKEIPEHSWYTIGLLIDPVGHSAVFVRDSETLADTDMDGSPDWKTPINAETGLRMYEEYGYGIEEGWACVHPGTLDDPMTSDIEGAGYALNENSLPARRLLYRGNVFSRTFAARSFDAARLYHGNDPMPADAPGYQIRDWWWDDIRVRGVAYDPADDAPPPVSAAYRDDFSSWAEGPLAFNRTLRWDVNQFANSPNISSRYNHTPEPFDGPPHSDKKSSRIRLATGFGNS